MGSLCERKDERTHKRVVITTEVSGQNTQNSGVRHTNPEKSDKKESHFDGVSCVFVARSCFTNGVRLCRTRTGLRGYST